jgi:phospholipase C
MSLTRKLVRFPLLALATLGSLEAQAGGLRDYDHIVVILEENHSFDNLWGLWGEVEGEPVNGLPQADAAHQLQLKVDGKPFDCLFQDDANLKDAKPAGANCFPNAPFDIEDYIKPQDETCPKPYGASFTRQGKREGYAKGQGEEGGCTRDLVHSFYNEPFQINGGRQNRYVLGSDAAGLVMGYYDTRQSPLYKYLHEAGAPPYVIADNFFHAAFGGSFINHQWLIAARTPVFENPPSFGADKDLHSSIDANGLATRPPPEIYPATQTPMRDRPLTAYCEGDPRLPAGLVPAPKGFVCGDFVVGTISPQNWPWRPDEPSIPRLPPLQHPTIGERLNDKHIDWAWYAGGWDNVEGKRDGRGWTNGSGPHCDKAQGPDAHASEFMIDGGLRCPDKSFQYHHQAFDYFEKYGPGTDGRKEHLRDEEEFFDAAKDGRLPAVSFVKPLGSENEHPGYASEDNGDSHLVKLVKAVLEGKNSADTLIIITYDEHGGAWDHVPPPPDGENANGAHDDWGPGTRVPAMLIAKKLERSGVDHVAHDTTAITKLIEERFCLAPLGERDKNVASLKSALGDKSSDACESASGR